MTVPEGYEPLHCNDYMYAADMHLELANQKLEALDMSNGLRAAIPAGLGIAFHAFNAYISALQALTVGTRTNR